MPNKPFLPGAPGGGGAILPGDPRLSPITSLGGGAPGGGAATGAGGCESPRIRTGLAVLPRLDATDSPRPRPPTSPEPISRSWIGSSASQTRSRSFMSSSIASRFLPTKPSAV